MGHYYEVEVVLRYARPRVWRRFLIRREASFGDLHEAIQIACGWENEHLFEFRQAGRNGDTIAGVPSEAGWGDPVPDAYEVPLEFHFGNGGKARCEYVYDFGDCWVHDVVARKVVEIDERFKRRLVCGARAFPQEDSGGIWGYEERVAAVTRAEREPQLEGADLREWIGDWHPDRFDLDAVKARFDPPRKRQTTPSPPATRRAAKARRDTGL